LDETGRNFDELVRWGALHEVRRVRRNQPRMQALSHQAGRRNNPQGHHVVAFAVL
jgi:hypothetical protein